MQEDQETGSGVSIAEEVNAAGDEGSGDTTMVKVEIILDALGLFSSMAEVSGFLEYQRPY